MTPKPAGATANEFDRYRSGSYFGALDGLRAISILLVLLHHVPRFEGWWPTLQDNGRYGVSFFFVISGFLICTLLLREREDNGRVHLGKFYARRSLRLFPLYYAVLASEMVLIFGFKLYAPENRALFVEKLPSYLFYFSNWLPTATQGPFFFSWSLAVEEQFYLLFSLGLIAFARRPLLLAIGTLLVVKVIVFNTWGNVDATSVLWRILFSYQEAILLGVLLAFGLNNRRIFQAVSPILRSPATAAGAGLLVVVWLTTHQMEAQSAWDAQFLFLLMTILTGAMVVRERTPVLDWALVRHVGKISYGIYLLHMLVINFLKKTPVAGNAIALWIVATIGVIILASMVYRYFELPIINYYKRRFSASAPVPSGFGATPGAGPQSTPAGSSSQSPAAATSPA